MSCEREVIETVIERILAPVSCPQQLIESQQILTEVIERLIAGPPGPVGPQGPAGEAFFWEPEAASDLAPGQPIAINGTGQGRLADATDSTRPALGLTTETTATGMGARVQVAGPLTLTDWTAAVGAAALTPGATYYLDDQTGKLTTSPPAGAGRLLQVVGRALTADTMLVQPAQYGRRAT